jgi:alkaline phosphatase
MQKSHLLTRLAVVSALALGMESAHALSITRLTPPSQLFATGGTGAAPIISRFVPGQRFDIQATVRPDAGQTITKVEFWVDFTKIATVKNAPTPGSRTSLVPATAIAATDPNAVVATFRAYANRTILFPGVHALTAVATQSDGSKTTAKGNFEIVGYAPHQKDFQKAKNIIILLGDGMGASHRTAARIVMNGYAQGKAKAKLAMDTFTNTAMIMTASLDTIITDSAPGMASYVTGNKANSGQEGVWPDDTTDAFDNPRMEYLSELLARSQGKKLGLVTTADVFDATPAANAVHTSNRGNGTGIVDQYLDDSSRTNLTVLMGGGRKWFLPNATNFNNGFGGADFNGSARTTASDYVLPADIQTGWQAAAGALDPSRNLVADFQAQGWAYVPDRASLNNLDTTGIPSKLLGLFSLSNMNIAKDKIDGRRGTLPMNSASTTVVQDYGFPDQPMLDEMAVKALQVLDANSPSGFVLMIEGASIDKQAHQMDSTRWIGDTIEFDHAVQKAKDYVDGTGAFAGNPHPDTLVIVTADHECSGAVIIGASTKTDADLQTTIAADGNSTDPNPGTTFGQPLLRNHVVGNYAAAGFPQYSYTKGDGFPDVWDPDRKLLIGYGANGDRYEDYRSRPYPTNDSQQPGDGVLPLSNYPRNNVSDGGSAGTRPYQQADGWFITGQVPGDQAVHTGGDIPLSAYGRGASLLGGTMDNTDVFFALTQAAVVGTK